MRQPGSVGTPLLTAILGITLAACAPHIEEGHYACVPGAGDACPKGWSCLPVGLRHACYRHEADPLLCGNGDIDPGEPCDGTELDGRECDGIGVILCTSQCEVDDSQCFEDRCGDERLDPNETCDDGDSIPGDGCSEICLVEEGWSCTHPPLPSECKPICGDSSVVGDEVCDDGNDASGDGCSGDCLSDESCGNDLVDSAAGETCDDGNADDDDGCASTCRVELGWFCDGEPSVCDNHGDFVTVSATTFEQGSPPGEPGRDADETAHWVTLSRGFVMQTTEVTRRQFYTLMGYTPQGPPMCDTCPVTWVSWHEAAAYCNRLSAPATGDRCYDCSGTPPAVSCSRNLAYARPQDCPAFRLPTEAEWELAARAGTVEATWAGDLDASSLACEQPHDILDPIAWFCGNGDDALHPVGELAVNPWGLFDLLGNVFEWCHDWLDDYPVGPVSDPWGPPSGTYRVCRGGSYAAEARFARAASRVGYTPLFRHPTLGFRPVRTLQ